jgi:methionyl-tRNA formyltransferase
MKLRIVFMGTPEFAVPSLRMLLDNGFEVVGVVTATDKPGGRGKQSMMQSAVKQFALERGLNVLQPERLKDPAFLSALQDLNANLQIVVAFRMLPEVVWRMPALGTFNLHGSLLPKYRGAAPINWAIIRGERETGVTTFFLNAEIDTGEVLFQERMDIGPLETAGEVHDRMMEIGATVVLKTVHAIKNQSYTLKKQNDRGATDAPRIYHDTCKISFDASSESVHNFVRGLSPYPGAWTVLDGKTVKILRTLPFIGNTEFSPGHFFGIQNNGGLGISTADGWVEVLELQFEGRKRMTARDFLKGYRLGT